MSEEMYPQELIDEYYNAIQELHEALNDKDQQITDLQHEKEVIQKALELARGYISCLDVDEFKCNGEKNCIDCHSKCHSEKHLSNYFKQQAKETLENDCICN